MHREMESRVVVVDGTKEFADFDVSIQFFAYLAFKRLLWRLAGFDLTARKLPPVFPLTVTPLRSKDTSLRVKDDSGYYFYGFHFRFNGHSAITLFSVRLGPQ